jgi:hypothetical protein
MWRFVFTAMFLLAILAQSGPIAASPSSPEIVMSTAGPRDVLTAATATAIFEITASSLPAHSLRQAEFIVHWNPPGGCWGATSPWPAQAQNAFRYAVDIWASLVISPRPIVVDACWRTDLPVGHIAEGGATSWHSDFPGAAFATTWYAAALANALANDDLNDHDGWDRDKDGDDGDSELAVEFNRTVNWYLGTDGNPPADQLELVSAALHELCHGLGFMGFAAVDKGDNACGTNRPGDGCLGWAGQPSAYDHFTEDGLGKPLLEYASPSAALAGALTGQVGGGLFFDGAKANQANGGAWVPLYAPGAWSASSYSHIADSYNSSPHSLMTRRQFNGVAEHHPGSVALGMLEDTGWTVATVEPLRVHLPLVMSPQPTAPHWMTQLSEDFEGPFPGESWQVVDENPGSGLYTWGLRDCRAARGSFSAWSVGAGDSLLECRSDYPGAVSAWMVYGPFSLAGATAAELTFDWWSETEIDHDFFAWGASVDDNHYHGGKVSGDHSEWTRGERLDLSAVPKLGNLLGRSEVWIGFSFTANATIAHEGSYVDNIVLRKRLGGEATAAAPPKSTVRDTRPGQTFEIWDAIRSQTPDER